MRSLSGSSRDTIQDQSKGRVMTRSLQCLSAIAKPSSAEAPSAAQVAPLVRRLSSVAPCPSSGGCRDLPFLQVEASSGAFGPPPVSSSCLGPGPRTHLKQPCPGKDVVGLTWRRAAGLQERRRGCPCLHGKTGCSSWPSRPMGLDSTHWDQDSYGSRLRPASEGQALGSLPQLGPRYTALP